LVRGVARGVGLGDREAQVSLFTSFFPESAEVAADGVAGFGDEARASRGFLLPDRQPGLGNGESLGGVAARTRGRRPAQGGALDVNRAKFLADVAEVDVLAVGVALWPVFEAGVLEVLDDVPVVE